MSPAQAESVLVTAAQMRAIEQTLFDQGLPVAALMEKVVARVTQHLLARLSPGQTVGLLVGPGHNGADTLAIGRELWLKGYPVRIYHPFERAKELTLAHKKYAHYLGIPFVDNLQALAGCDVLLDGLLGFGWEKALAPELVDLITTVNTWQKSVISIDLPSGLHTDTGQPQPVAIQATHTLCLGLGKVGLFLEPAQPYVGTLVRLDLDIPPATIAAVIGDTPALYRLTAPAMRQALPLPRPITTHKYQCGHLLLVVGSRTYGGAAVLAALGARASGVGLLSVAVPQSLQWLITSQVPEALVIPCPETDQGAIAQLPVDLDRYDLVAVGPGLTLAAKPVVTYLWSSDKPLLLDADALNALAPWSQTRSPWTVLTPHAGEFQRLFPALDVADRLGAVRQAAQMAQATVVLKGAKTLIARPNGTVAINAESTPGLARGGSGDVLTGLLGGLLAQGVKQQRDLAALTEVGVWWHAQTGLWLAQRYGELSVHPQPLAQHLGVVLGEILRHGP
ncbi:MAG: NAD(P)H-hydrate dehydratase [Gloeomargarita sp. SZTDM-1c_bins_89]